MLTIRNYVRAQSLDEAYALSQKRSNVVLGGMLWLKMQNRAVNTAIDLCDLGLNEIRCGDDGWHIGAMVSLRALEMHEGLNEMTQGAFSEALKHIVGVQFRNCATVGGSLYGRFGFSDVLTLFQVLDAKICLHRRGQMSVEAFAELPSKEKDILTEVIVPRKNMRAAYRSLRRTATDFPVLACAVSQIDGKWRCAVGARPFKAVRLFDEQGILSDEISEENAEKFGQWVSENVSFGSNMRGSVEYRKKVCAVLVRRALMSMEEA